MEFGYEGWTVNTQEVVHSNPLLADVFELLHRMEVCKTLEPFQWMARDAIRRLEVYEKQQIGSKE